MLKLNKITITLFIPYCENRDFINSLTLFFRKAKHYIKIVNNPNSKKLRTLLLLNKNSSSNMTGSTAPQQMAPTVILLQDRSSSPNSPRYSVSSVLYHMALRHMYIMRAVKQQVSLSVSMKPLYEGRVTSDVHIWKSAMYSIPFDQNICNNENFTYQFISTFQVYLSLLISHQGSIQFRLNH